MKTRILPPAEFLSDRIQSDAVLFDSRSPAEYAKGHIPGALSLPLLNDEHRHEIGILYKQQGRQAAVIRGFELAGPFFHALVKQGLELARSRPVYVYCWRGGLRSNISACLLTMAGLQVTLLDGGYKAFRHLVLQTFEQERRIVILGGKTGSGKTEVLSYLKAAGAQVIDLEGLANHKGSAFGALGQPEQPSQEHFENLLATALMESNPQETVWLENESRQIGNVNLPNTVYEKIRSSPLVEMQVPYEIRQQRILNEYGIFEKEILAARTERIGKRLGNNHLKDALMALSAGDLQTWLDIILTYYDKTYAYGNELRNPELCRKVDTNLADPSTTALQLIREAEAFNLNSIHATGHNSVNSI